MESTKPINTARTPLFLNWLTSDRYFGLSDTRHLRGNCSGPVDVINYTGIRFSFAVPGGSKCYPDVSPTDASLTDFACDLW